ncbi:MAG TPA: 50S ribosomal protein L11 methyltransferase [Steroidobacteraceae bacterium]|jgi:ribosomal protein L11 methyltransferase
MAYLELSFELGELEGESAASICHAAGALSVTFSDAQDDPVLEPGAGELRLWRHTRLQALYDATRAGPVLISSLAAALGLAASRLTARAVEDRVWEREWLRDFHAMRFGRRLWICPRHETVDAANAVVVRLDPGLAFGTGTHPSTAMCLNFLDQTQLHGSNVVDYGCGAGALAIAALKLGARRVYAYDIDPQALTATRDNALDNGVADRLQLCDREDQIARGCGVLLANILAPVLIALAPRFTQLLPSSGRLLLAGVLAAQESEVASAFLKWFDISRFAGRDGWVALAGLRK